MIKEALSDAGLRFAEKSVVIVGSKIGRRVAEKIPHPVIRFSYRKIFAYTNQRVKPEPSPDKTRRDEETDYSTDDYLFTIRDTFTGNGINR
jgi:hypothetical protein